MPRLLADLTPMRESPPFRRLWTGLAFSSIGTQLTIVAVSLQIYALTGSSLAVGALGIVALVPLVLAGLYGGSILDAFDRRKVALYSALALWGVTMCIALQAWFDLRQVWLLYVLTGIQSGLAGINQPSRNAIVPRLVRPQLLPAANALTMIVTTLSLTVGPLMAGILVAAVGYGWTYTVDVLTFTVGLWALYRLPPIPPEGDIPKAGLRSVLEGLRFLSTRPNIRMTFLVDLAAMVLAQPRALMPAIGAVMIGGGATTVGILLASTAFGGVVAALFSGPLGMVRRQGVVILWCVAFWGLAIIGFGLIVVAAGHSGRDGVTWWLLPACLFLMLSGVADSISAVFRSTILQAASPDSMRGRLQGVFIVVVAGGPRLGDMMAGGNASWLGEGFATVLGGILCVIAVVLLRRFQPRFSRYDAQNPEP